MLAKLAWYRLGGEVSDRQWRDVVSVLHVQADRLDHVYLRTWAKTLAVSDLLAGRSNRRRKVAADKALIADGIGDLQHAEPVAFRPQRASG